MRSTERQRVRERDRERDSVSAVSLASFESRGQSKKDQEQCPDCELKKERKEEKKEEEFPCKVIVSARKNDSFFVKETRRTDFEKPEGARKKLIGRRVFEGEEERERERRECGRKSTRIITPR